jgi:alpha,alpha-trehalase
VVRVNGNLLNRYWDESATPRPESYKEDIELAHQSKQDAEELYRHLRAAAESGWDFSSRWFKDEKSFGTIHTTEVLPVDLNCLLYYLEKTMGQVLLQSGGREGGNHFAGLAEKRKQAIQTLFWNDAKGFFFDYDFVSQELKQTFTLAAAFPLFFEVATPEQAKSVADVLQQKFLKPGGMTTTLVNSGQQWDAPNGWAPLQWIVYRGLLNYGHAELAKTLRRNWMNANEMVYQKTGKMTEKYDVWNDHAEASGGEYPNQDGFGWTNGVYLAMKSVDS